jgi:hypothetical protein
LRRCGSSCPSLVPPFVFIDMNQIWVHPFGCLSQKKITWKLAILQKEINSWFVE